MIDKTQHAAQLYSAMTLEKWLLSIPVGTREQLIESNCGTSAGYILKRVYSRNYDVAPLFKLKIAVGLDKASLGQLDFRDFLEAKDEIDFVYLHKVLGQRLRAEAAAKRAAAAPLAA